MITSGVDTAYINIAEPLRQSLDLRFKGVLRECKRYRFSNHFTLSDDSFPTDFQISIAIQDHAPAYIKRFINEMIRDNVSGLFSQDTNDTIAYPHIPLFNISEGNFSQMCRYYYNQFCGIYKKEFISDLEAEKIPFGPQYSYQYYAYPVWQNSDSTLITWKFYSYCYLGGPHGGETEYYLTFDNETGRILGVADFFTTEQFDKAIDILTRQLNAYHNRDPYKDDIFSASLDEDSNVTAAHNEILNESVRGKTYPRPALTRHGIVFTYQTYEKEVMPMVFFTLSNHISINRMIRQCFQFHRVLVPDLLANRAIALFQRSNRYIYKILSVKVLTLP